MPFLELCSDCHGQGSYCTEWSDAAERLVESLGIKVLFRPDPPDGTVCVECKMCNGDGYIGEVVVVCNGCKKKQHQKCRGGNWCDCQHRTTNDEGVPPEEE